MLMFPQTNTPAVKAHFDAQCLLFSDLSRKFFDAAQKIGELNVQAAKAVMEESLSSAQQMMAAKDAYEVISVAATQAQPAAEKVLAYQRHLTNIAAQSQVELVKTAESHAPNTARAVTAVADEIARKAVEETEKVGQRQQAAIDKMANVSEHAAEAKGQAVRSA